MSGKKLSKNIIIYGLSNGLKSLVPFIMLPILTNYISSENMGLLSLIETSILFLTPFVLLNIEAAVNVEYFKTSKEKLAKFLSNGLITSLASFVIISIIFFTFKNQLNSWLDIPVNFILLLPILVLLRLIPSLTLVLYQAMQKPINYLVYSLSQTIVDFGLSALFVIILQKGFIGRIEGTYIGFFAATIIGIVIIKRLGYLDFEISKTKIISFLNFGAPLIPHAVGASLLAMSDRYFISYFEGNSFVGYYTVAYQIGALMLLFSRSVNQAWSPMMFGLLKNKDFSSVRKFTTLLTFAFIVVGLVVYVLSDLIFELLIDPSFFTAKVYFGALLIGFIFQSLYMLFANFIFFSKKTKILAWITSCTTLVNLVLNYVLIIDYGVIGVAYATAITWFIYFAITALIAEVKIYPQIKSGTITGK